MQIAGSDSGSKNQEHASKVELVVPQKETDLLALIAKRSVIGTQISLNAL